MILNSAHHNDSHEITHGMYTFTSTYLGVIDNVVGGEAKLEILGTVENNSIFCPLDRWSSLMFVYCTCVHMYLQSAVTLGSVSVDTSTAYNNGASLKLQGKVRRSGGTDSPALARYGGRVFLCMVIQHFMPPLPTPLPTFHTCSIRAGATSPVGQVSTRPLFSPSDLMGVEPVGS